MNMLHTFLEGESALYAKWHQHPRHTFHHFLVLVVVAVCVTMSLLVAIFDTDFSGGGQEAVAIGAFTKSPAPQNGGVQGLTNQLFKAIDLYVKMDERNKPQALEAITKLLTMRTDALVKEMEENPVLALTDVLPADVLASLPPEIAAKLEQYITVEGTLEIQHFDLFDQKKEITRYKVKDVRGDYYLYSPSKIEIVAGSKVTAKGVSLGSKVLLEAGGTSIQSTGPLAYSSAYSTGSKKSLVILINYTDNLSQPYTPDQVKAIMFTNPDSVAAHYGAGSYGKLTLTGDVVPAYVTVPYSIATPCDGGSGFDLVAAAAVSGAQAQGFTPSNYNLHTIMTVPVSCRGGGAYYPGSYTTSYVAEINMYGQPSFQEVAEHELGHNFGQNHSSSYNCGAKSIDVSCTRDEYGDTTDALGGYNGQLNEYNVAHKVGFGWFATANIRSVTTSGTYTIAPLEGTSGAVQTLRIAKPDTGEAYYVGYRQPVGMDAGQSAGVMTGASIWMINDAAVNPDWTKLLDLTPGDGNIVANSALSDGMNFSDPANGITVTQVSHDTNGVTVSVQMGGAVCTPHQSTVSLSPATQSASQSAQALTYTMSITNTDSSTCSPVTYAITPSVPAGWTVTAPTSVTVNPGSAGSANVVVTSPSGTANSTYDLSASASDASQALHTGQASASYVLFTDAQAPTVTVTSPSNGAALKGANVTVSATASDNVGVAKVEFYVDNALQVTDSSAPYSFKMGLRKFSAGAHVISAKAYDAVGNSASASVSVTI